MTSDIRVRQSGDNTAFVGHPGRLWSLWDIMREFKANHLAFLHGDISAWIQGISPEHEPFVPKQALDICVKTQIAVSTLFAVYSELPETEALIQRILWDFVVNPELPSDQWKYRKVKSEIFVAHMQHLKDLMQSEMDKKTFLLITGDKGKFYNNPEKTKISLFGIGVDHAFPSAFTNIIEAGNCIACERNNAAAYHLMLVAETGMRALAWDRRVVPKSFKRKIPIELAEWGALIEGIEKEVSKISGWRRTLVKAEAEKFYNAAIIELRSFNNGWRTHVMHGRAGKIKNDEILALWGHVLRFMQTLSAKISEEVRTPLVWKAARS